MLGVGVGYYRDKRYRDIWTLEKRKYLALSGNRNIIAESLSP